MTILGIGTDIVNIERIQTLYEQHGERFSSRILTKEELSNKNHLKSDSYIRYLAKRFAAKEACAKALGTGIGEHASFHDIIISNSPSGVPTITLRNAAMQYLQHLTPTDHTAQLHISLSDDHPFAIAYVTISALPTK